MTWIEKHHRVCRTAILVLLLAAFMGPWTFDLIWVPSGHFCFAPYIRLDDDFCGIPLSGIWLYHWITGVFIDSSTALITGELVFTEWIREYLFCLFIFLPLLPIFNTLILIQRKDHPQRQVFTITAYVLAICMALFWGLNNYPKLFWMVWGIWLYMGLAVSALILETLVILSNRKDPEVLADAEPVLP
jgi:hypothetical protein